MGSITTRSLAINCLHCGTKHNNLNGFCSDCLESCKAIYKKLMLQDPTTCKYCNNQTDAISNLCALHFADDESISHDCEVSDCDAYSWDPISTIRSDGYCQNHTKIGNERCKAINISNNGRCNNNASSCGVHKTPEKSMRQRITVKEESPTTRAAKLEKQYFDDDYDTKKIDVTRQKLKFDQDEKGRLGAYVHFSQI
eukprot:Pgem_evm1s6455